MHGMPFGRAVVTGAAGFLGGYLVARAKALGATVVPVVRTENSASDVAMDRLLGDPALLDGTDVLVHAAAIRHRYGKDESSYRTSNVDLVEALMRASKGRVGRFVFVSSVGVYGFPRELPIDEHSPYAPRTLYSQTKIDAEDLVRRLGPELGLATTIVRPTILYGRGDTNGMLDKLAAMLRKKRYLVVGSGNNSLHHTHVEDAARGIFELAISDTAKGEHFIVAGPETITLGRLGELVARAVGTKVPRVHVPLRFARAVATCTDFAARRKIAFVEHEPPINHEKLDVMTVPIAFDTSKAKGAGFTATIRYEEGIARTLGGPAA